MSSATAEIACISGHYSVQSHLRSLVSVPNESRYATSYYIRVADSLLKLKVQSVKLQTVSEGGVGGFLINFCSSPIQPLLLHVQVVSMLIVEVANLCWRLSV